MRRSSDSYRSQRQTFEVANAELIRQAQRKNAEGSGHMMVTQFDLMEAEGYVGRGLGSEKIQRPTPLEEIIESIEVSKPKKTAYPWGIDG